MKKFSKKSNSALKFFQDLGASYARHKTDQMAAALSLYAILSLPSLVVLIVSLGSFFMGQSTTKQKISDFIAHALDEKTSGSFVTIIDTITSSSQKTPTTILSFLMLIFTATALFDHLIHSLHAIWATEKKEQQKISAIILNKLYGLCFILFIDVILFLSFFIQKFLNLIKNYLQQTSRIDFIFPVLDLVLGFILPFLLFLFIFKILTHSPLSWKKTSLGAFLTSVLFVVGNFFLGMYFENFVDYSAFGAANTLITILVWIYYTSQILFIGAEITGLLSSSPSSSQHSSK